MYNEEYLDKKEDAGRSTGVLQEERVTLFWGSDRGALSSQFEGEMAGS
jgi:hypothetical protein